MEIGPFEDLPDYENIPQNILNKIKKFEDEHNVKIYYDIELKELVISKDRSRVGAISPQRAPFDDFLDELHLNFEVDPGYRGKGFGKFLYSLYQDFYKLYPEIFPLPEREYTQKVSMLMFYVHNNVYSIIEKYDEENKQFQKVDKQDLLKVLEEYDNELDTMYRLS